MNDKQKIATFILALICNFTFLATAASTPHGTEREFKKCSPMPPNGMDSMKPDYTRNILTR